jgi:predicted nuclease with TOPRIM domain
MESQNEPRKGISPHWIYGGIIALLIAAGAYLFVNKNKVENQLETTTSENVSLQDDKSMLETEYNASLARLDEMKNQSVQMDSLLSSKSDEVEELKSKIKAILSDKNATASQLKEANNMIKELNAKMKTFQDQIVALKQENIQLTEDKKNLIEEKTQLTTEKTALGEEKKQLEKTVEVGSVLKASGIEMEALNQKKNLLGKEKEKETEKAKKVDFIRIRFNIDDNRISESGEKILYICVYEPNGNIANGGQKFKLENGTEKFYTTTRTIPFKKGETLHGVTTDWKPTNDFFKGNYKVEIYHMGYLIGTETVSLK